MDSERQTVYTSSRYPLIKTIDFIVSIMRILIFYFLFFFFGLCGFDMQASVTQEAEIRVQTNYKDVQQICIVPFGNMPLYIHAVASLNNEGEGVIRFALKEPMLVELKCLNGTRPMRRISLYIEPGKSISVAIPQGQPAFRFVASFTGDLSQENDDLQTFSNLLFLMHASNVSKSQLLEMSEKVLGELTKGTYESCFKSCIKEILHLTILEKYCSRERKKNHRRKCLQELAESIKKSRVWQSIYEWPRMLDHVFELCEDENVLKTEGDLIRRLDCIGDTVTKCHYGLYKAEFLVNGRGWFENPPVLLLEKLKPYMTTPAAQKRWNDIYTNFEQIASAWKHLRTAPAPDFTFENTDGKMVTLSEFRGMFVLLDVWNIYCGPCKKQVPILRELEPKLREMGVEVIGVSCDPQSIKNKWKESVKNQNMSGIQTIMDNGRQSQFMQDYCIIGFPTFILINPDGMVVNPYMSYPQDESFLPYIRQKIEEYNKKKIER